MEGHLHELEANAEGPQHGVVPKDEGLAPPAQSVRDHELVEDGIVQDLPVHTLPRNPKPAVVAVASFWQLLPQL